MEKHSHKETAVTFYKSKGHNHDGRNSTKVDFTKYSNDELRVLADLLDEARKGRPGDAADVISGADSVGKETVYTNVDPPSDLVLTTGKTFDGHERTYIDAEWAAPPVYDFYYDEYYFDPYNSSNVMNGANIVAYHVAIQKEGEPESDHRTITKNTKIRFWDVDPERT